MGGLSWGGSGGDYYPYEDNTDYEALRFQQIRDSVYLTLKNPCLQEMVTKAVYENIDNQISRIVNLVFEDAELIDLSFYESTDLQNTDLAIALVGPVITGETERMQADIFLNTNVLPNSSQEMVISTIFHEVLHAYLGYSRNSNLFNDHQEMANEYLSLMTSALQNLFPTLSTKSAQALSWGGLSETTAWKNLEKSDPTKTNEIVQINKNHTNGTSGTICE